MPKLGMEVVRRRQVIDAAVSILSNQGWRDLTIREVSEVANVSVGVVTHYFSSKRAIIVDAISDTNQRFSRTIGQMERKNSNVKLRLAAVVDLMTRPEAYDLPNHNFWIALYGRLPFDQVIQAELQRLQRWLQECVAKIVKQGIHQGDFKTDHLPEDIAANFVVSAFGQIVTAAAAPTDLPTERRRKLLLDMLGTMLGTQLNWGADASVRDTLHIA
ncbi:TetR/AcrR family transcriptional regulator [Bradyrhizobium sp. Arg237L]|uniref:TetR/AcrR family transcriptional regulator n=1 Tax=Bradyrhizobium sp. Arg237L TaxID=3003352 RepID=UPI00249F1FF6|nr:TetR/AcrR family transcriptional regulator [Bradyrhizobium sp. Arg237L]MDI4234168.1 TetR/AcrR family transcriptional regulator [Bradyrhizobium sp. Arg237L]